MEAASRQCLFRKAGQVAQVKPTSGTDDETTALAGTAVNDLDNVYQLLSLCDGPIAEEKAGTRSQLSNL